MPAAARLVEARSRCAVAYTGRRPRLAGLVFPGSDGPGRLTEKIWHGVRVRGRGRLPPCEFEARVAGHHGALARRGGGVRDSRRGRGRGDRGALRIPHRPLCRRHRRRPRAGHRSGRGVARVGPRCWSRAGVARPRRDWAGERRDHGPPGPRPPARPGILARPSLRRRDEPDRALSVRRGHALGGSAHGRGRRAAGPCPPLEPVDRLRPRREALCRDRLVVRRVPGARPAPRRHRPLRRRRRARAALRDRPAEPGGARFSPVDRCAVDDRQRARLARQAAPRPTM